MICRYEFQVSAPLSSNRAYALYGALLSLLSPEYGQRVHQQGETPLSQYLCQEEGMTLWRVQVLDGDQEVSAALDGLSALPLYDGQVGLSLREKEVLTAHKLTQAAGTLELRRYFTLRFLTPTAFRQAGCYVVLPEKELILQSLVNKWNAVFPDSPMEEREELAALSQGVRVTDYHLRTSRFSFKDCRFPGFLGDLTLDAQLPPPLLELWKSLLLFAQVSGIGMKTALGMGGVTLLRP